MKVIILLLTPTICLQQVTMIFRNDFINVFLFVACFSALLWRADASDRDYEHTTSRTTHGDACRGVKCPYGRICETDKNGRPVCVCLKFCPAIYQPVCGSDNKTYGNICQLLRTACLTNKNITEKHGGPCEQVEITTGYSKRTTARTTEGPANLEECAGITCPVDKRCKYNSTTNKTTCECNQVCYLIYRPVCGSDNVTYSNDCFLRVHACLAGTNITEVHEGPCSSDLYCDGIRCPSPGRCEPDSHNRSSCVCPEQCPEYYDPVCGSNGKTYRNTCELRVDACKTHTDLTVAYNGTCRNACAEITCPSPRRCLIDSQNRSSCVCQQVCPLIFLPVCGSNGKTYSNGCELRVDACETGTNITVAHDGPCRNECAEITCPSPRRCVIDSQQRSSCVCQQACPLIYLPVCGSNGKTYDNKCVLEVDACETGVNITVAYDGPCRNESDCVGVKCPYPRHCKVDSQNRTTCVCPEVCTALYDPVCGTNGKTYSNTCELERDACKTNTSIRVAYNGTCRNESACARVRCPYPRQCVIVSRNRTACVCPRVCPHLYHPVCGSNGKTYSNPCELTKEACLKNVNITIANDGQCDPCLRKVCPANKICVVDERNRPTCKCRTACPRIYSPVCGTDNETYSNECELKRMSCVNNTNITVAYEGICRGNLTDCRQITCPFGKTCYSDARGGPRCVCYWNCPFYYNPVCGSDGNTYYNQCFLLRYACLNNLDITVAYRGRCRQY